MGFIALRRAEAGRLVGQPHIGDLVIPEASLALFRHHALQASVLVAFLRIAESTQHLSGVRLDLAAPVVLAAQLGGLVRDQEC